MAWRWKKLWLLIPSGARMMEHGPALEVLDHPWPHLFKVVARSSLVTASCVLIGRPQLLVRVGNRNAHDVLAPAVD